MVRFRLRWRKESTNPLFINVSTIGVLRAERKHFIANRSWMSMARWQCYNHHRSQPGIIFQSINILLKIVHGCCVPIVEIGAGGKVEADDRYSIIGTYDPAFKSICSIPVPAERGGDWFLVKKTLILLGKCQKC